MGGPADGVSCQPKPDSQPATPVVVPRHRQSGRAPSVRDAAGTNWSTQMLLAEMPRIEMPRLVPSTPCARRLPIGSATGWRAIGGQ